MFKQFVFFVLAVTCVSANLNFQDCGSTAQVHALRIQGCASLPCVFRRASTYIIEVEVTSRSHSNNLPLTIQGIVPLLPPITVLTINACTVLTTGNCPATVGQFKVARIPYTVGPLLPSMNLPVRFTVLDDAGLTLVCGQIPVTITG